MVKKLFKFGIAGGSAALINLGLFAVFTHIFSIHYLWAVIFAHLISASVHFCIQKFWVFAASGNEQIRTEGLLFFSGSVINILINEILIWIFIEQIGIYPVASQFLSLAILACFNYATYEMIIFKKDSRITRRVHAYLGKCGMRHILLVVVMLAWGAAHLPGILYGTGDLPLHQSYVGDEQSPVNGALHILQDKNPLALRNIKTLYYGPVFASIAVPAVAGDFAIKYISGEVTTSDEYKNYILWDWGGIVVLIRIISVAASVVGLCALFLLARTRSFNPTRKEWLPYFLVALVGLNFYYFEYSHFFKHWIFILTLFLLQLYVVAKLVDIEDKKNRRKLWIWNSILIALGFGISYVSVLFQVFWIGFLVYWIQQKNHKYIKEWCVSIFGSLSLSFFIYLWHPYALLRIFRGGATIPYSGEDIKGFAYYGKLLLLNHTGFFIAGLIILFISYRYLSRDKYTFPWLVGLCAVGISQYLLFSYQPGLNREGRYMLPAIVMFIVAFVYALGLGKVNDRLSRIAGISIAVCILFTLLFHAVHITKWIQIFAEGPIERQMLNKIKVEFDESDRILLVQYYIAGIPHTETAYRDYMERFGKNNVNLYHELLSSEPPQNKFIIDAYYIHPNSFEVSEMGSFDRVLYHYLPRREINQFDYFDENLIRLWWHTELSPSYKVLK